MTRLTEDLLILASAEQADFLRPQPIALEPFISHLWEGLIATAQRSFELGPVPKGTLLGDPDRLAQALRNLIRNAIEHTADGVGLVRLEVRASGDEIQCLVSDDGPGIPADERERVFERFHRTDAARNRSAGGAGLGLAIARAIAEAHGGHIRATEADGTTGARIELVLPGFVAATASRLASLWPFRRCAHNPTCRGRGHPHSHAIGGCAGPPQARPTGGPRAHRRYRA